MERYIVEAELLERCHWLVKVRWVFVAVLTVVLALNETWIHAQHRTAPLWGVAAAIVVYNIGFTKKPPAQPFNAYYDPCKVQWLKDRPDETVYLIDGCAGYSTYSTYPFLPVNHVHTSAQISVWAGYGPYNTDKYVSDRHLGGANYLTFAGSVHSLPTGTIGVQVKNDAACIWDR